MRWFVTVLCIFHFSMWPSAECWLTDTSHEQMLRSSRTYKRHSNTTKYNNNVFDSPEFVTAKKKCVGESSNCLHAQTALNLTQSRSNPTPPPPPINQVEDVKYPQKLQNMYPTKEKQNSISKPHFTKTKLNQHYLPNKSHNYQVKVGTNNTEGRIIAYKMNVSDVAHQQAQNPIPRVTLGQVVRKAIFPDWIWTRFATNRQIEVKNRNDTRAQYVKSTGTGAPTPPKSPSVTFDSNFSRFMKLFTMVRFENTPCIASPSGRNGTCYHSKECTDMGGTATNSCASGFGVCCVFQNICGDTTSRNGTYFVDNGVVFSPNAINTCTLQVLKMIPNIRQMRLDFDVFSLQQPNAGNCELDRFIVSGQNINNIIPILCGENNNTHLYVETEGSSTGIQLSIMTTGLGDRKWSIRITQFESGSNSGVATNCLQYHTGAMGSIQSFNYISPTSPQYLNNLNYGICIRKESGFCSVTFINSGPDGTYMPFQIVNANDNGHLVIPGGQAGVGVRDCPYDFILINGYRLCGERLNDATTNVLFVEDAPVTDQNNGPCIVTVRSNELDVGGGFFLYYRQNPCMSVSG